MPTFVGSYLDRGNSYFAKGAYARALTDYNEAIRISPEYAAAYLRRGQTEFYSGEIPKAVADLKRADELNPKNAFTAIWLEIAEKRGNLPSELTQTTQQIDNKTWPAPIIRLYLRHSTPAAVLAAANDPEPKVKKDSVCQANFYIGELESQRGGRENATRLFRSVIADCPRTLTEWFAANAELNAVGSNH